MEIILLLDPALHSVFRQDRHNRQSASPLRRRHKRRVGCTSSALDANVALDSSWHANLWIYRASGTLSPIPNAKSHEGSWVPQNSKETIDSGNGHGRFSWKMATLVSFLLLLPCFWQSRIQSIDLSSHIYNTWLASLIAQKQAPGLWIARQSSNVLFDLMLAWLFPFFGAAVAQKIAVGTAVLIFSWGAILLISRGRPKNWWFLLPSVAVFSYGFIFHAGFFNFYLGMGICFWYLAFVLSGGWRIRCLVTPLLLLAWTAHPMPVVWAVGLALYIAVAERLPPQGRLLLLTAGAAAMVEVHFLLVTRYQCIWSLDQAWFATGAKQLMLFGRMYEIPCWLFLAAWAMLFWRHAIACRWRNVALDMGFQLWLLTTIAVVMIPAAIAFPLYAAPFNFVSLRLSLAAGIMLGAFLGDVQPKGHERVILTLGALIFFGLVFRDARKLNLMEDKLDAALEQVPAKSRVIGILRVPSRDFSPAEHAVDRACIGRCFSYANYEPSTGQFRVRAEAGNPIVMADYADVYSVELGRYRVQAGDLPVFLIYLCGPDRQQVCSRELHGGEVVGSVARAN